MKSKEKARKRMEMRQKASRTRPPTAPEAPTAVQEEPTAATEAPTAVQEEPTAATEAPPAPPANDGPARIVRSDGSGTEPLSVPADAGEPDRPRLGRPPLSADERAARKAERDAARRAEVQAEQAAAREQLREQARQLTASIVGTVDALVRVHLPPELAETERAALVAVWTPVVEKELAGRLDPLQMALLVSAAILAPRVVAKIA